VNGVDVGIAQKQRTPGGHHGVLLTAQHPTRTFCRARGTRAALAARKPGEGPGLQEQRCCIVEELLLQFLAPARGSCRGVAPMGRGSLLEKFWASRLGAGARPPCCLRPWRVLLCSRKKSWAQGGRGSRLGKKKRALLLGAMGEGAELPACCTPCIAGRGRRHGWSRGTRAHGEEELGY
jgi:hypothetical protein